MHVSFGSAMVVTALVASALLVMQRGDRVFPVLALIAAGVEALILFGVLQLSIRPVRIEVILAGLLFVAGAACWARASSKGQITAATIVACVGLLQLLTSLRFLQ